MDVKQRFRDFQVLLKSDRRTQVIVGVVALAALFLALYDGGRRPRKPAMNQLTIPTAASPVSNNEALNDLQTRFVQELENLQSTAQKLSADNQEMRGQIDENAQRNAEIFKKILQRMQEQESLTTTASGPNSMAMAGRLGTEPYIEGEAGSAGAVVDANALEPIFTDSETSEPEPQVVPAIKRTALISAGDSVRVKLLAGVQAPTNGRPYPVVFEIQSDVAGPDGTALPVGRARVMAAAQGSIADQRAMFRLSTMSVRFPSGEVKEVPIDGWVVGEDGILGLEGVLFDPFGKALAGTLLGSTVEGIGAGIASSNTSINQNTDGSYTETVTGDILEYGVGRGITSGANEWSQYIREKSKEYVPYVRVLSGREATAVFSKSAAIPGLFEALGDEEIVYASLD